MAFQSSFYTGLHAGHSTEKVEPRSLSDAGEFSLLGSLFRSRLATSGVRTAARHAEPHVMVRLRLSFFVVRRCLQCVCRLARVWLSSGHCLSIYPMYCLCIYGCCRCACRPIHMRGFLYLEYRLNLSVCSAGRR